jgi:xanthine dehydrogenase iron-sulfur cluster and FAD-binding subunit A
MKKELVELRINRRRHELAVEPRALRLDVLRQDLGLTGSKRAYDESSCAACSHSAVAPGDDWSLQQARGVGSGEALSVMP